MTDNKVPAEDCQREDVEMIEKPVENGKNSLQTEVKYPEDAEVGLFTELFRKIFTRRVEDTKVDESPPKMVKIIPKKLERKHALPVFDTVISILVVGPLVIGHWRGVWNLMDYYNLPLSGWLCCFLGTALHWIFTVFRSYLHNWLAERCRNSNAIGKALYGRFRLFYTYIFCVACNMQWRGGWMLFSSLTLDRPWVVGAATGVGISILVIFRSSRNLLAPPYILVVDIPNHIFKYPTRYKTSTRDWVLYILDCAFSVGIVGTLVVFVWRGVWVLLDVHLYPKDREYSSISSLVIGYVIVAVTFSLQPVMRYTCSQLQGLPRLIMADLFLLVSFFGTVNVWRGIWSMLDLWFLPDNSELSCWITHIGCFVFLGLLNCSNSILVRGVYIDAEEEEGKCVIFPCHYLRLFFKIEREKKEAKRRNLVAVPRDYACEIGKDSENGTLLNCTTLPTIVPSNRNIQG